MSDWTKERLEEMIANGVEENLSLDYKRADALAKTDGKRAEVTKDVSAFANSAGGMLIYGVAEFSDDKRRHLPEKLDPVQRTEFSKEWLDQVIQTIQPRIQGLMVHPVTISDQENTVCYIVEVPQSDTAHMARDHRYYKRHNFNALPMEDYEVRDVMNRTSHPQIRASIFVNKALGDFKPEGLILVKVENIGRSLARNVMVELELPYDMNGQICPHGEDYTAEKNDEGDYYLLRLIPEIGQLPIYPGSYLVLKRQIHTNVRTQKRNCEPVISARNVKVNVFADEMPALRARLDVAPVLLGWTPVMSKENAQ